MSVAIISWQKLERGNRVGELEVVELQSAEQPGIAIAVNARKKASCGTRLAGLRQRPDVGGPPEGEPAVGGCVAGGRVAVAGPLE